MVNLKLILQNSAMVLDYDQPHECKRLCMGAMDCRQARRLVAASGPGKRTPLESPGQSQPNL